MKELGFWKALVDTWTASSLRPTQFFGSLAPFTLGPAFLYALLVGSVGSVFTTSWFYLMGFPFSSGAGRFSLPLGADFLLTPMTQAAGLWLGALAIHLGCMVLGCAKQGFSATFRIVAYASSPAILGIFPGGTFVAGIWTLVLMVIGIREMQRTSTGRALFAIFFVPIVLLAFTWMVILLLFLAFGSLWW